MEAIGPHNYWAITYAIPRCKSDNYGPSIGPEHAPTPDEFINTNTVLMVHCYQHNN